MEKILIWPQPAAWPPKTGCQIDCLICGQKYFMVIEQKMTFGKNKNKNWKFDNFLECFWQFSHFLLNTSLFLVREVGVGIPCLNISDHFGVNMGHFWVIWPIPPLFIGIFIPFLLATWVVVFLDSFGPFA